MTTNLQDSLRETHFLDSIDTDVDRQEKGNNTSSDEDWCIAKFNVTDGKVKRGLVDLSPLNHQDWMAPIQQYHFSLTWPEYLVLLWLGNVSQRHEERSRLSLYRNQKGWTTPYQKLTSHSVEDSGEDDQKVHKGCGNEIATSTSQSTCIHYREIH